ncbi:hypothetical protein E0L21_09075 [Kosakonia quasisacchari]|uniref:Anti-sigma factor n=1 Tax=Kosakonia quasisacchari TaxID=2529380 RepID=A0A4R0HFL4_9ENTR|nr:hypothetical protein [Kosakonia quasisacchari]TCC09411.1 hypothetical protein E0L21_09075 [Kosakonia quasisacchari]
MKPSTFTHPYQDDAIVAWLDGEMSEADAQQFEHQLAQDEQLANRTEALRQNPADFAEAFAPLLDEAPAARMQARLNDLLASPRPSAGVSRRSLIAASLSFLVIGSGLGYFARPLAVARDESEKIRDLEAQYMSLYSAETLLDADSSPTALQRGLARTAQDIGLSVKVAQLALSGAELKMVRMLRYDSTSIAQIAWMDAEYGPMALCISPERERQTRALTPENRHDMHLVWWQQRGYQFVLIGRNPPPQLSQHAQALHAALS